MHNLRGSCRRQLNHVTIIGSSAAQITPFGGSRVYASSRVSRSPLSLALSDGNSNDPLCFRGRYCDSLAAIMIQVSSAIALSRDRVAQVPHSWSAMQAMARGSPEPPGLGCARVYQKPHQCPSPLTQPTPLGSAVWLSLAGVVCLSAWLLWPGRERPLALSGSNPRYEYRPRAGVSVDAIPATSMRPSGSPVWITFSAQWHLNTCRAGSWLVLGTPSQQDSVEPPYGSLPVMWGE